LLGRVLAFQVQALHHADALTLNGFMSLDTPTTRPIASAVANVADPVPYGVLGLLLVGIALARGRIRTAAAAAAVLLGAAATTDYVLKPLFAAHRVAQELGHRQVADVSFPSGHATASMALALCAILVVSPGIRPYVAALGAAFAVAVSFAFLTQAWHYPSDVLGGYLVAAAWMGAAVAGLRWADARWPAHTGRRAAGRAISRVQTRAVPIVLGAIVLLGIAFAVTALSSERALGFLRVHTIFAIGAGAIALAGLAVAGALAALLRE
jgi:membrane-associated phospholipid phosphatase